MNLTFNPIFKQVFKNINWLFTEKILRLSIGIFIFAWIARYLGPENFGIMNYSLSFVILFSALSTLGLDNIIVRNLINNSASKYELMGSGFFLKLLGSFFLIIFSTIFIIFLEPNNENLHLYVFLLSVGYIFKSFDIIDFWFQSKIESKYVALARSISFLLVTVIKVILILMNSPLIAFILMFTFDLFLTSFFLVFFYTNKEKISLFQWKIKISFIKDLLKDSWPLFLSGIAIILYMKIDQVMIGKMLGNFELGIYSTAVKLSESWYFIPMIIANSVFPLILKYKKISLDLYISRLQLMYDFFTFFSLFVALFTTFFSSFIISILFGSDYIAASNILSIHIWTGIFVFLGVASSRYLVAENLTKISFYRTLIGLIMNLILNFVLIPILGIQGAAYSTLISYFFSAYFSNLFFSKSRIIFFMQTKSFYIIRFFKYYDKIKKIILD